MRKRNSQHDYLPKRDDVRDIDHLPRDVRLGARWAKVGTLLYGFCNTTETWQLWAVVAENQARFIGYVIKEL